VDVFQVMKALHIQKPGSVLTVVGLSRLYLFVAGCVVASSIVIAKERTPHKHYRQKDPGPTVCVCSFSVLVGCAKSWHNYNYRQMFF